MLALKWLSAPHTARRGNLTGEIGMLLAIIGALLHYQIISYQWIIIGFVVGAAAGAPMAIWNTEEVFHVTDLEIGDTPSTDFLCRA